LRSDERRAFFLSLSDDDFFDAALSERSDDDDFDAARRRSESAANLNFDDFDFVLHFHALLKLGTRE